MICYVLAMGKQHLGPHVVLGYGIKIFWPGLFITSPDHLVYKNLVCDLPHYESPIAQWLERPTGIWKVMGSTPVGGSENLSSSIST